MSARELLARAAPGTAPPASLVQVAAVSFTRRDSQNTEAAPVATGLSLRSNFTWVLAGNVVYATCQWGMIVALAKLGSTFMVGQFSLGLAIATPVLMFTNLHLRAVQATDARGLYSFGEYLQLRMSMTLAAMAVIVGIVRFGGYERRTAMVILAVALAKGIETLSDIHYGLFQLNDRLDQTGTSMMLRGVLSVGTLSAGLWLTKNVVWACVGLALVWLMALLFFDVRRGSRFVVRSVKFGQPPDPTGCWRPPCWRHGIRRQWNLMRLALPLGIVTTMASINLNMPRYFIHAQMGEHQLGIFSAMAYATVAMTIVSDSLGHCAIPRMSRMYSAGQFAEFRWLLLRLLAVSGTLGLAGLAAAQVMGTRLLTIFYSPEYAAHSQVFILLMFATAINCVASILNSGITSARCFRVQVPMFALVAVCGALACTRWVPTAGLAGGAVAMAVAAAVHLVVAAAVLSYLVFAPAKRVTVSPPPQPRIDNWEPGL